jgi:hypothetical protein
LNGISNTSQFAGIRFELGTEAVLVPNAEAAARRLPKDQALTSLWVANSAFETVSKVDRWKDLTAGA